MGVIFIVNIIQRTSRKLRRITLLHFGLVTFRIHFRTTRKPIILMVSGTGGRDHDSRNQLFLFLEAPRYFKTIQETSRTIFKHVICGNLRIL